MSLRDCLDEAVAAGEMDRGRADRAKEIFDQLVRDYDAVFGPDEAIRRAGEDTVRTVKREDLLRHRNALLQLQAQIRAGKNLDGYRNHKGEEDPSMALKALLDHDDNATYSNVDSRKEGIRGLAMTEMSEVMNRFRSTITGSYREKAGQKDLVRELFGEKTGKPNASEMAEAVAAAFEYLRKRFNRAGGHIGKLDRYGLPQSWDITALRRVTVDQWVKDILPLLDRSRMLNDATGRPMNDAELEAALKNVFQTIGSNGQSKIEPSGAVQGRAVANRRADHRFLIFRDADAWLTAQAKYGSDEPMAVITSHLETMSRDIAMMEILGPNPQATMNWAGQKVLKRAEMLDAAAANKGGEANRARRAINLSNDMMRHLTGTANTPVDATMMAGMGGLRSVLQAAQLGAATISAVSDVGFYHMASSFVGIPTSRVILRLASMLNPADAADRKAAIRFGLLADGMTAQTSTFQRFGLQNVGPEVARRMSDSVMRLSGLNALTQAGRWANGMEMLGYISEHAGKAFDDLDEPLRNTLRRGGIGPDAWDVIRTTKQQEHRGAGFIVPGDLMARTDISAREADELATRMLELVHTHIDFAVPGHTLRGRATILGKNEPGTITGELLRSVAMYKSFPIAVLYTHGRRAMTQQGAISKGRYMANLMIMTTMFGAFALQMKEISKGRDPRPMDTPEFWGAAMLQGGGLGILGDFFFSDLNRFGSSLGGTIVGPIADFAEDTVNLTLGNAVQLATGEKTNFGREAIHYLRRYTPGSSLWYARLGIERLVLDQLQLQVDPGARRAMQRLERKYSRDYGQGYWWRPGATSPGRAPDFGNMGG